MKPIKVTLVYSDTHTLFSGKTENIGKILPPRTVL